MRMNRICYTGSTVILFDCRRRPFVWRRPGVGVETYDHKRIHLAFFAIVLDRVILSKIAWAGWLE